MGRIRSIKPEFPQSETIGRLSRDARLLFIQLWTLVDDSGRARAPSRMLASLLYPYDDDAPALIEGWLSELEHGECLIRYEIEGATYLQITNWLKHQKIDHAKDSKLPAPPSLVANPREPSRTGAPDQGSGREGDRDQGLDHPPPLSGREKFDHLESQLREAAGAENNPSPSLCVVAPILGLIDQGADLESEILPAIRAKPKPDLRSWDYVVPQIQEFRATRKRASEAPVPQANGPPGKPNLLDVARRVHEQKTAQRAIG